MAIGIFGNAYDPTRRQPVREPVRSPLLVNAPAPAPSAQTPQGLFGPAKPQSKGLLGMDWNTIGELSLAMMAASENGGDWGRFAAAAAPALANGDKRKKDRDWLDSLGLDPAARAKAERDTDAFAAAQESDRLYNRIRGDTLKDRTQAREWTTQDRDLDYAHSDANREDNQLYGESQFTRSLDQDASQHRQTLAAKQAGATGADFGDENGLRNQYLGQSKTFTDVRDAYSRIKNIQAGRAKQQATDPNHTSAASDISLVFNFMKMNDPGSTVREGEYATAQNAAGVPDQIRNQWNKLMSGESLNPNQRNDFESAAKSLYDAQEQSYAQTYDFYRGQAPRYNMSPDIIPDLRLPAAPVPQQEAQGNGPDIDGMFNLLPESVRHLLAGAMERGGAGQQGQPVRISNDEEFDRLPPGTDFIDPNGVVRTK